MTENAYIDANSRNTLTALANDSSGDIYNVRVNPITGALLVEADILSTNTDIGSTILGGTEGSVLFIGTGSTLAQDNANFFWDDLNNFLGLGNNTPAATLHVSGSVEFDLGTDAEGDIYYRDASGILQALPVGNEGDLLVVQGGLPAWSVTGGSTGYNLIQNEGVSVTQRSTINLTNLLTATDVGAKTELDINVANLANDATFISTLEGNLDLANIGGQINLATQVTGLLSATNIDITNLQSTLDLGSIAGDINLATQVTGTLGVSNGGTGASTLTGVLHGNGTSAFTAIPLTTNGAILIGDGSGEPTTLSAFSSSTGNLKLSNGGTGASLSDPGANNLMGWDDTDNSVGFWTLGSGLSYDHASHTISSTAGDTSISATAQEDLTAGDTVGFSSSIPDSVIKAVWSVRNQTTSITKTSSGGAVHAICEIDTDKYIVAYYSNTNVGSLVCVTLDRGTMQFIAGTPTASNQYQSTTPFALVKLDTDKFALCVVGTSSAQMSVKVGTVSGTTISLGSSTVVHNSGNNKTSVNAVQLGTDSIALISRVLSSNPLLMAVSVSGTTPSLTDSITLTNLDAATAGFSIVKVDTNKVACYQHRKVVIATLSGTWTQGGSTTLTPPASSASALSSGMKSLATNTFYVILDSAGTIGISYCTVSGSVITEVASTSSIVTGGTGTLSTLMSDGTDVYSYIQPASGTTTISRLSVSGATVVLSPTVVDVNVGFDSSFYGGGNPTVTISNMMQAFAENPTSFVGLTSTTPISNNVVFRYHVQGFTNNFIGIVQSSISEGATATVSVVGADTNQTGIVPGSLYIPYQGGLQITSSTSSIWTLQAQNSTTILI